MGNLPKCVRTHTKKKVPGCWSSVKVDYGINTNYWSFANIIREKKNGHPIQSIRIEHGHDGRHTGLYIL